MRHASPRPRARPDRRALAHRRDGTRWSRTVRPGTTAFPGMAFPDGDPDAFVPKEAVADYFVAYAEKIARADPLRRRGRGGAPERRPARLPRRDLGGRDRGRLRRRRHRPVPAPGHPRPRSRRGRRPADALHRLPQSRRSCPKARCWSSARAPRARRSPTSSRARDGASISRSARTTVRRARYRGRDYVWWLGVLGKWDARGPGPGNGACHDRGERRPRRPDGRLPAARGAGA